jgi:hypothetical protein
MLRAEPIDDLLERLVVQAVDDLAGEPAPHGATVAIEERTRLLGGVPPGGETHVDLP